MTIHSHWSSAPWPPGETRLHWYAVPPEPAIQQMLRAQSPAAQRIDVFTSIPAQWLHCTLAVLQRADEVSETQVSELLARTQRVLAECEPIQVAGGRLMLRSESVAYMLTPTPELLALAEVVREISAPYLRKADPGVFVPHVTLNYSHSNGEYSPTLEEVMAVDDLEPFVIDAIHLVNVEQEPGPDRGWYSWDVLGTVGLGGTR